MTEAITTANKKAIFGLSMGHFMVDLYASALIPLYPLLTSKLGIKLSTISLIIALGHLCSSMMQIECAIELLWCGVLLWGLFLSR